MKPAPLRTRFSLHGLGRGSFEKTCLEHAGSANERHRVQASNPAKRCRKGKLFLESCRGRRSHESDRGHDEGRIVAHLRVVQESALQPLRWTKQDNSQVQQKSNTGADKQTQFIQSFRKMSSWMGTLDRRPSKPRCIILRL